ncbi:MAG: RDD family protein [Candidatus Acidiferrales bacterium]
MATAVVSSFVWFFRFQRAWLGYSMFGRDGVQHVVVGTSLWAIIASVLGIGLFFLLQTTELQVGEIKTAPMWRRYAARFIDLWFFVFVFANTTAIVPLLIEAARTGSFRWYFERDYSTSSDWLLSFLILIGIAAMASYFVLPLANRRQTIGPWLLRIATVDADGLVLNLPLRVAFRWTYAEFSELFSPLFLWKTLREKDALGRTFYDRESGFTVVRY